jgi:hypothetical protein
LDCACILRLPIRDRGLLLNPLMRTSYIVVVVDELTQDSPQMSLIQDKDMIQALLPGCSYSAFGI